MHDYPYFFNPDERNMASAITRFRFPDKFNPHFFAYGQFPLYLAFTSNLLRQTDFPTAIFWLRFYSALSSTLTVYIVYLIARKLMAEKTALLSALITAFLPGLIQSAHFGTTESLLTFFFMTVVYLSISRLSDLKFVLLTSLAIGLSLGSKLTSIFFFVPPLISLIIRSLRRSNLQRGSTSLSLPVIGLLVFIGSIFIFVVSSPYNWIEPENFKSAVFGYEADVATGKYEAFYTRQFVDTLPILFQAEKIFPYVLGWPVFILGTLGFLLIALKLLLNFNFKFCLLTFAFLIYSLPNSFLFAKWTRFMTPILPFFAIFAVYAISKINKFRNLLGYWVIGLLVFISLLPGITFMKIYLEDDTRVTASKWIYENIPDNTYILSETANVVDIPLGIPEEVGPLKRSDLSKNLSKNYQVISFDFYHLDENPKLFEELLTHLGKADYILIPSRRIFANYTRLPKKYPIVTRYYELLFSGKLGFEKTVEISVLADEQAEETFTVFDHPVIRIYRKIKPLNKDEYASLLKI